VTGRNLTPAPFFSLSANEVGGEGWGEVAGTGGDLTFTTIGWPAIASVSLQAGLQLSLQLNGTPGTAYTLETSTNLIDWTVRTNCVMNPSGWSEFVETGVTNPPARFYRLRWP